ncbi:hypothetical protein PN36_12855 [Candidatus Thiomargarita nelsonii]|uniref:Uncharacterized protein n=1 Tax=Candidatus Thiomargarita nelsonii TaxID=1003181 RepID=A0A0A6PJN8_9GAMM|nr:hypothetical protein PN36_12855 [Candidatus Thiomargarita nelsonii]
MHLTGFAGSASYNEFNLDDVEVWEGITRASRGGATDWELFQIYQNPQWWDRITFMEKEKPVSNLFERRV